MAFWISDDPFRRALLIASVVAVLVVELLNTGVEKLCDLVHPGPHPAIKAAKDMGSRSGAAGDRRERGDVGRDVVAAIVLRFGTGGAVRHLDGDHPSRRCDTFLVDPLSDLDHEVCGREMQLAVKSDNQIR